LILPSHLPEKQLLREFEKHQSNDYCPQNVYGDDFHKLNDDDPQNRHVDEDVHGLNDDPRDVCDVRRVYVRAYVHGLHYGYDFLDAYGFRCDHDDACGHDHACAPHDGHVCACDLLGDHGYVLADAGAYDFHDVRESDPLYVHGHACGDGHVDGHADVHDCERDYDHAYDHVDVQPCDRVGENAYGLRYGCADDHDDGRPRVCGHAYVRVPRDARVDAHGRAYVDDHGNGYFVRYAYDHAYDRFYARAHDGDDGFQFLYANGDDDVHYDGDDRDGDDVHYNENAYGGDDVPPRVYAPHYAYVQNDVHGHAYVDVLPDDHAYDRACSHAYAGAYVHDHVHVRDYVHDLLYAALGVGDYAYGRAHVRVYDRDHVYDYPDDNDRAYDCLRAGDHGCDRVHDYARAHADAYAHDYDHALHYDYEFLNFGHACSQNNDLGVKQLAYYLYIRFVLMEK
jgi:hypothetical protein